MKDSKKIYNELREMFIFYEYRRTFPPITAKDFQESKERAMKLYTNNPSFYAQIEYLVTCIMRIVEGE